MYNIMYVKIKHNRIIPGDFVFKLMDEKGIPLETICILTFEKEMTISWAEFFECAKNSKNYKDNLDKLIIKVKQALIDAGYCEKWFKKLALKYPDDFQIVEDKK